MWETFISWYINNYLGHYIENLNSQQLSLALSKGELELENVPLKKNIFRSWGLPIQVKSGVVGRIRIEFNILKYFRNEPILISIEDVCLVAEPVVLSELDPWEEKELAQESKMIALDSHEARWKTQFDLQTNSGSSYYSSLYVSSMRIGASIVTKVVENLQLNVNNVHIRFEFENEHNHRLTAFGITLESLHVQSCDHTWNPLSSTSTNLTGNSYKTMKMVKLGVYCDTKAERLSVLQLIELKTAMTKPVASQVYLLSPVSAETRITKNNAPQPLSSLNKPRFDIQLSLERVPLQLSDSQYKHVYRTYKYLRKLDRNCRLRLYRPLTSPKGNTKVWWIHASQAVLSLRGYKRRKKLRTWQEVMARAKDNCGYVAAYQQHLTEEFLSEEARKLKARMESELHFDDIVALRQAAMRRMEQMSRRSDGTKKSEPQQGESVKHATVGVPSSVAEVQWEVPVEDVAKPSGSGILSWFFPSWGTLSLPSVPEDLESSELDSSSGLFRATSTSSLTERSFSFSENEFDEAILDEVRAYGKDTLLARLNFLLDLGSVVLHRDHGSFLDLNFGGVCVDVLFKPRTGSHKFQMKLSSLMMKDCAIKSVILGPHIPLVFPAQSAEELLFKLTYEMKPHKKAGHHLSVSTKPLDLLLYPSTWDEVVKFFSVQFEEDYLEIPYNGYEAMKQKTKEELQVYWDRLVHSKLSRGADPMSSWEIYMDIFAPQITIYGSASKDHIHVSKTKSERPREGSQQPRKQDVVIQQQPAVVVDLGRFRFTNIEMDDKIRSPSIQSEEIIDTDYTLSDNDDDEEFLTPCSSPLPEMEMEESVHSSPSHSVADFSEPAAASHGHKLMLMSALSGSLEEIHTKFYKKYSLEITDVQVIVIDGNTTNEAVWRATTSRGPSSLHFIDDFSINLRLERRLVYSEDPLWPALTLVGSLPKLTFHLNECKIATLQSVFSAFTWKTPGVPSQNANDSTFLSMSQLSLVDAEKSEIKPNETLTSTEALKSLGKLFVAEFTIHNVSVEIEGRHRNIAEIGGTSLEVLLTVETVLSLRRFFADAADSFSESLSPLGYAPKNRPSSIFEDKNLETCVKLKSLNVMLANARGHLAEAQVIDVSCELKSLGQECFGVQGRLGSLEVRDVSNYAGLYPVKFAFQGGQALDFEYARHGLDGKFRLTMASMVVVHTNRFYTEFMTIWNAVFSRMPAYSAQHSTAEKFSQPVLAPSQNVRVILNIQAGAPVILLPCSSTSESVLVADLGHLSIKNKFMDIPDSSEVVINCISIDLIEMDLYSGELRQMSRKRKDGQKQWDLRRGWSVLKTEHSLSFLQQQCQMNLKVKQLFEGTLSDTVATTHVQGILSAVHCTIEAEKYKLIRGLLAHNIGENIVMAEELSHVPGTGANTGKSQSASNQSVRTRIDLNIELDLVNVTVEVLNSTGEKLGRVDFLKSKFTFQSNSDGWKDVDLASQEIIVYDARFEGKQTTEEGFNIFTNILQQSVAPPAQVGAHSSSHSAMFRSDHTIQAEINYRMTPRGSIATIVLNNVRLMIILDWWMEVKNFLSQEIPRPSEDPTNEFDVGDQFGGIKNAPPLLQRARGLPSPITVSAGIVTKRVSVLDVPDSKFELKINISNCELVVVENASVWDTNALILKASAAFWYRPRLERPISCNILQCELFSCILGLESDTALSILDPTHIQFDILGQSEPESKGILDATVSLATSGKILKIQSPNLNLRLSYYDLKMFLRLMEKFSKEAQLHFLRSVSSGDSSSVTSPTCLESESFSTRTSYEIDQLTTMGFPREEAIQALEETHGCLEDAVFLLTKTSRPDRNRRLGSGESKVDSQSGRSVTSFSGEFETSSHGPAIHGIDLKCNCFSICIIDDCKDSDVPVAEFSIQQLELYQNCIEKITVADCIFSGDYYNRTLSGWEPFLEPWRCNIKWKQNLLGQLDEYSSSAEFPARAPEFDVTVSSRNVLEVNITSSLLSLYKTVSANWAEDYQHHKGDKRRAPFVPFALKNETGSRLWFCTIISNNEEVVRQHQKGTASYSSDVTSWIEVAHGSTQNFSFEGRGKLRHRNTHQLKIHQLALRVDGWSEVTPVSVDRVGTYFRVAKPETSQRHHAFMGLPPTRLVLDVSLQGSAQKIVTVRSALMIKNELPDTVELKLENTIVYPSFERAQTGGSMIVQVRSGQTYPIPLHSVWAHLWIRPVIPDNYPLLYLYCTKALLVGSNQEGCRECYARSTEMAAPYRFCVAVKRNEFPADSDELIPRNSIPSIIQLMSVSNRANLITLISPFKMVNLLPHEISYEIRYHNVVGRISPGKWACMTNIDILEPIELHFQVDNFPQGATVIINSKSTTLVQRVKIQDTLKRTLVLTVKVLKEDGGVLSVVLSCPCWIVNKSGLPLLCKQEGTTGEAAGQFEEHEVGRMVTPLMMSFVDREGIEALTLRVGTGLHKGSKPSWCRSFACQPDMRVRKLTVSHLNNSPESVYMIGVEVKSGTGRYSDTRLVVLSPRFVVDNRSSCRIEISQRAYATSFFDAKAQKTHLTLPAGCNLPFHWPRLDKEQLLCVRLKDVESSLWSGGFPVDNVDSFHINIRDAEGKCYFLRVEVVLQGPSYFVIFSDTTQLPPPFRVDNFALVNLVFNQACLAEERLKITAKADTCNPYVLDEPTQQAHLTVSAPGGASLIVNMDDLRYTAQLTYENYFYIAFSATFPPDDGRTIGKSGMESLELVLDVEGTKVVLSRKERGKRSQLWRVRADGLIEHEGSSPPRDLRKPTSDASVLVLDIAGQAPVPSQCTPLMLRKPDRRRQATQHWQFTADGRLQCKMYDMLYVQAKDGFGTFGNTGDTGSSASGGGSWKLWSDVVLGPSQPVCYVRTESGIPAEQAVCRQKLHPGSGVLNLSVSTDGPTRVLQVIDVEHPPRHQLLRQSFEENDYNTTPKYRLKIELPAGFGFSIISCNPREELVYGRLLGFVLEWTDTKNSQILRASVLNLQMDNHLLESEKSAVIYTTASGYSETLEDLSRYDQEPALNVYWEGMKSNLNARVFKVWELIVKPINLIIEERLLLKLSRLMGFGQQVQGLDVLQQSDFEVQKALRTSASVNTKRYYFGVLKIVLNQVKLSVLTSSKLSPELAALKRRLGLTLIRFEDANVELDPFEKNHPFETFEFFWALVVKHYRDELVSQAAVILGSTDFLGNPLGFVNDVSEGVSLMIYEGSVGALVKNVAHGLSNSAAKVTGTLGEGLGRTILDERHEEERRKIKEEHAGSSGKYLYAGLKGFGHGLLGGVTSVVSQTYEGYSTEGGFGFVTGLTKGIVGTVTKPAVGVLDLATGAASAIRDSSKTSSRMIPPRMRPTRVVVGNGGLLPVYSEAAARGQELLYEINDKNFRELFIACDTLKSGPSQELSIMISSTAIIVFRPGRGNPLILKIPLSELVECHIAPSISPREKNTFIEFVRFLPESRAACRPQVVCENEHVAKRVIQQVNYAKVLFEEMRHSQIETLNQNDD